MQAGVGGGDGALDVATDPAVEIVAVGGAADVGGGIFADGHGKRLALGECGDGVIFAEDVDVARENIDGAAIVEIIQAEGGASSGFGGEIAAGNTEIIAAGRIDVEGSGSLAEDETRGVRAIVEREIEKLDDGIFVEEGHGTIFKFDSGAAVVGGENVALTNGEV